MNKLLIISAFSMLFFQVILGFDLIYSAISVLADLPRSVFIMTIIFILYVVSAIIFLMLKNITGV